MDRFVSSFTNRLDAKGRVSIPAPYRAVLARDGFEGLYVHPSLEAKALDAGGNGLLGEIDGLIAGLTPFSDERAGRPDLRVGQPGSKDAGVGEQKSTSSSDAQK